MTSKQKKAAYMYFNGKRMHEIASELGVHRTTVWRWFQRPNVQQYYARISESECRKILKRKLEKSQLYSDDPVKVNAEANRVLDMYLPFVWRNI